MESSFGRNILCATVAIAILIRLRRQRQQRAEWRVTIGEGSKRLCPRCRHRF